MSKLSELTKEIAQELENAGNFVKLKDKEERVLQFDPELIQRKNLVFEEGATPRPVVEYTVVDPKDKEGKKKVLTMSRTNAMVINDLLQNGKTLLAVKRYGEGTGTKYTFIPQ